MTSNNLDTVTNEIAAITETLGLSNDITEEQAKNFTTGYGRQWLQMMKNHLDGHTTDNH